MRQPSLDALRYQNPSGALHCWNPVLAPPLATCSDGGGHRPAGAPRLWQPGTAEIHQGAPAASLEVECAAKIIPLGERHLRKAVEEYRDHCHFERNHQGLDNELIEEPTDRLDTDGAVERRERLGGILNDYHRRAA